MSRWHQRAALVTVLSSVAAAAEILLVAGCIAPGESESRERVRIAGAELRQVVLDLETIKQAFPDQRTLALITKVQGIVSGVAAQAEAYANSTTTAAFLRDSATSARASLDELVKDDLLSEDQAQSVRVGLLLAQIVLSHIANHLTGSA